MHGLRGHPQHTWEDSRDGDSGEKGGGNRGSIDRGNKVAGTASSSKRKILKALFKPKPLPSASTSTTISIAENETGEESPTKLFWPDEFLTQDIPEARVWTYGYNADAIGELFRANNKNSVSQHGRDLAVLLEREIQNEVGALHDSGWRLEPQTDDNRTRSCSWRTASAALSSKMFVWISQLHD